MNDREEITLSQFFLLRELREDSFSAIEATEKIALLKERLSEEAKGIKWPVAFREMIKKAEELLDISISDIMVSAWKKYRILLKYTDRKNYPPDETFLVTLAEHTIKSEHHPSIEILVNEKAVGKVDFTIHISLILKGMILKIQDGKIMEIITGSCKGKGSVECEGFPLMEKETEAITLPGSIHLGEGIPIAP